MYAIVALVIVCLIKTTHNLMHSCPRLRKLCEKIKPMSGFFFENLRLGVEHCFQGFDTGAVGIFFAIYYCGKR